MKELILILSLLMFGLLDTNAQVNKSTKVFFNADEFVNNTPGIFGDHVRIRLDVLFRPNYILIKSDGKRRLMLTNELWGYLRKNQTYRIYDNRIFSLINSNGFLIYKYLNPMRHFRLEYYFSQSAKAPLELLTIENLKSTFKDNLKFCSALRDSITNEQELTAFDKKNKMYRIINLYGISSNQD